MDKIIVDTSAWIEFFKKKESLLSLTIDEWLEMGIVYILNPILSEVVSGSKNKKEYDFLNTHFAGLPLLTAPKNIWKNITRYRYSLLRKGYTVSLIDLYIAVTTNHYNAYLLTLDTDFGYIKKVLDFKLIDSVLNME